MLFVHLFLHVVFTSSPSLCSNITASMRLTWLLYLKVKYFFLVYLLSLFILLHFSILVRTS